MRNATISGDDLRSRIDNLHLTYRQAADRLGLSPSGLHQQMRNERAVSRQTELLLAQLEREQRARSGRTPVEPG